MCRLVVLSRRGVLMRMIFADRKRLLSATSAMEPSAIIHWLAPHERNFDCG
jgi:hypothetical protein